MRRGVWTEIRFAFWATSAVLVLVYGTFGGYWHFVLGQLIAMICAIFAGRAWRALA